MQRVRRRDTLGRVNGPDARWHAALDVVGAVCGDRDAVFQDLVDRYGAPDRHYHVFAHADGVVEGIRGLATRGDDRAPVELAGWFHDAVYDPTAAPGCNEGASAVLAETSLRALGVPRSAIAEVVRLVCLTTRHEVAPGDRNGALLCDADLATLAAGGGDYDRYVQMVRAEHPEVDDDAWRVGRRIVLRSFLDRPSIFATREGRARFEARARINISDELATLA